jgi:hypothetical protein
MDAHRAIIGISGSEKKELNDKKLDDFFTNAILEKEKYSLYVRNGATIVGGHIIPDSPFAYDVGTPRFPFRDAYFERSSIHFLSGSNEESGSEKTELARISVNENTKVVEFKTGSNEFRSIQVREINIGTETSGSTATSSVQISGEGQGFIAVHAQAGKNSTIFRAEHPTLQGDLNMGSITQKGSGSFAILLDADGISPGSGRPDAKFVIESNAVIPGTGTRLFSVSESLETRAYGHLKVDTNITASGNISSSGTITALTASIGGGIFTSASLAAGSGGTSNYNELSNIPSGIISSSLQILTNITASGNISASGNLTANKIIGTIDGGTF